MAEPTPAPEEKKLGRPTDYTQELADEICAYLAEGMSLRTTCLQDGMPDKSTVFRWLRLYSEFRDQYARAKEEATDAMAEEVVDIADDGRNDWIERQTRTGEIYHIVDNEAVQRSKLRVETRKWLMSKMKPKKYGDKLDLTSDGKRIEQNAITFVDFSKTQKPIETEEEENDSAGQ